MLKPGFESHRLFRSPKHNARKMQLIFVFLWFFGMNHGILPIYCYERFRLGKIMDELFTSFVTSHDRMITHL